MSGGEPAIRRAWRITEPLHALIYFVPEAPEHYAALGLDAATGYLASRSAAMGAVRPGPVIATFYNFSPAMVTRLLPQAWVRTTPDALLAARLDVADAALRRGLGDSVLTGPEMAEAAALARRAAEAATAHPQGRPLFAAYADLAWPEPAHLVLWHAQTLLREFRGDGHVAALMLAGVTGLESMILHIASGGAQESFLRPTRGWSRTDWAEAVATLRGRGLIDGDGTGTLTEAGAALRTALEETTDRLTEPAYAALSSEELARLPELTRPMSRTVVAAGMLNPANAFGTS